MVLAKGMQLGKLLWVQSGFSCRNAVGKTIFWCAVVVHNGKCSWENYLENYFWCRVRLARGMQLGKLFWVQSGFS